MRSQAKGCLYGGGCGIVVALLAAVVLGLCWLVLLLFGWRPSGGGGWLILSSAATLAVLVVALPLVLFMVLVDTVPQPVPRRLYFAWLLVLLPVLAILAIVSAWICYALGALDAARYLGFGPWLAGLGIVATATVVYSGVVAHDERRPGATSGGSGHEIVHDDPDRVDDVRVEL
jgi:hypothetical protein